MYRYLTDKTADYVTTTLSVNPTTVLPQTGERKQVVHDLDDGSVSVVGISDSDFFNVQLQWKYISDSDYTILKDFYFNETKGAGRRRTFYWEHPKTGKVYTVRFMTTIPMSYDPLGNISVSQITLRVEGNKP